MKKMQRVTMVAALGVALSVSPAHAQKVGQTRAAGLAVVERRFLRFDANADGTIDLSEVTELLTSEAKDGQLPRPAQTRRVLARFDQDGDGKATLQEAKAAAGERFDAVDVNKNGRIDPDEITAATPTGPKATQ